MNHDFKSLVSTWQKAYFLLYPTPKKAEARLKELETWDTLGNEIERAAKIQALKNLVNTYNEKKHDKI